MMKLISRYALLLILLFTIGCNDENQKELSDADFTGTILEVNLNTNQILIEEDNASDSASNTIWINQGEQTEIIIGGVTVTDIDESLVNRKATVWIEDLIAQSSPPQATAIKIWVE